MNYKNIINDLKVKLDKHPFTALNVSGSVKGQIIFTVLFDKEFVEYFYKFLSINNIQVLDVIRNDSEYTIYLAKTDDFSFILYVIKSVNYYMSVVLPKYIKNEILYVSRVLCNRLNNNFKYLVTGRVIESYVFNMPIIDVCVDEDLYVFTSSNVDIFNIFTHQYFSNYRAIFIKKLKNKQTYVFSMINRNNADIIFKVYITIINNFNNVYKKHIECREIKTLPINEDTVEFWKCHKID